MKRKKKGPSSCDNEEIVNRGPSDAIPKGTGRKERAMEEKSGREISVRTGRSCAAGATFRWKSLYIEGKKESLTQGARETKTNRNRGAPLVSLFRLNHARPERTKLLTLGEVGLDASGMITIEKKKKERAASGRRN